MKKSNPVLFLFLRICNNQALPFKLLKESHLRCSSPSQLNDSSFALPKSDSITFHPVWEEGMVEASSVGMFLLCPQHLQVPFVRYLSGRLGKAGHGPTETALDQFQSKFAKYDPASSRKVRYLSHASFPESRNSQWSISLLIAIYKVFVVKKGFWAKNKISGLSCDIRNMK